PKSAWGLRLARGEITNRMNNPKLDFEMYLALLRAAAPGRNIPGTSARFDPVILKMYLRKASEDGQDWRKLYRRLRDARPLNLATTPPGGTGGPKQATVLVPASLRLRREASTACTDNGPLRRTDGRSQSRPFLRRSVCCSQLTLQL